MRAIFNVHDERIIIREPTVGEKRIHLRKPTAQEVFGLRNCAHHTRIRVPSRRQLNRTGSFFGLPSVILRGQKCMQVFEP